MHAKFDTQANRRSIDHRRHAVSTKRVDARERRGRVLDARSVLSNNGRALLGGHFGSQARRGLASRPLCAHVFAIQQRSFERIRLGLQRRRDLASIRASDSVDTRQLFQRGAQIHVGSDSDRCPIYSSHLFRLDSSA